MRPIAQCQGGLAAWGRYQTHLGCMLEVPCQHGLLVDLGLSCKHLFNFADCCYFLNDILPFLVEKREQADLILNMCS